MVRPIWVAVAFGTGVAVGVLVTRSGQPTLTQPSHITSSAAAAPSAPAQPLAPVPRVPESQPAVVAVAVAPAVAQTGSSVAPPSAQVPTSGDADEYTGYSLPIALGPVFEKSFAADSASRVPNSILAAHRALEREMRDDSWSYPLEAELQNSLVADASAGKFNVEHVECRATACEVRLSGIGSQFEAMTHWSENQYTQPWSQRLQLSMSSTIGNGNEVERLIILKKPVPLPKRN